MSTPIPPRFGSGLSDAGAPPRSGAPALAQHGALAHRDPAGLPAYGNGTLPAGIRSRVVDGVNGLKLHLLEAGFEAPGRPALLLLHGFPELAYSWRELMLPLAGAGFRVIAPDRRGYGRTTGWDDAYDADLEPFSVLNRVRDLLALLSVLPLSGVEAVIGHDFGAPLAAWCALIRPDVFRSLVMMSSPFTGPPAASAGEPASDLDDALAALPRPRKYYMRYYTTRDANAQMQFAPQGLHDFLRAYFHMKSADWPHNRPFPLSAHTADELAKLPEYYVMDKSKSMAATVAPHLPAPAAVASNRWLTEADLAVYTAEYARTGFQGGLNEYRCLYDAQQEAALRLFTGRRIEVPALFVGGRSDWGVYQSAGALEQMRDQACTDLRGIELLEGAGHWVQQEQPARVAALLLRFLRDQGHAVG